MTDKERVHRVLEGKPVDRPQVTELYNHLYYLDYFSERKYSVKSVGICHSCGFLAGIYS